MIALRANETVFTVLGESARRRGTRSLALQFVISAALATAILAATPQWWSLAFLAGWSAAYSAWGLVVHVVEARQARPRSLDALLVAIAALGTALAVAGIIGFGLAMYTGNARGAKGGPCPRHGRCDPVTKPAPTHADGLPASKLPVR